MTLRQTKKRIQLPPEVEVEVEVQETVTEEVTDSNSVKLEEVGTVEGTEKILKNKSSSYKLVTRR